MNTEAKDQICNKGWQQYLKRHGKIARLNIEDKKTTFLRDTVKVKIVGDKITSIFSFIARFFLL